MTDALGPITGIARPSLVGGQGSSDSSHALAGGLDERRMAALRLAIADGRYPLDFDRLAVRLIELGIVRERGE